MRRYRPRKEVKMWLYLDKPEEKRLVEFVSYLKKTRKLANALRNGLRLIWSLGEGDTSVLFELFPSLEAQILSRHIVPTPPDTSGIEKKLERIERMIEQGAITEKAPMVAAPPIRQLADDMRPALMAGQGNTLGKGKRILAPTLDDDGSDTLVITKHAGGGNGANLLAGALGLG